MGTNFYLVKDPVDNCDPAVHVGKRSAAGMYCWDCGVTLCKRGVAFVHADPSRGVAYLPMRTGDGGRYLDWEENRRREREDWEEVCPKCGQGPVQEDGLKSGPVAVELGFAQPYQAEERKGVRGVSSFTWAMPPETLAGHEGPIWDEYEREYTLTEFREQVLANCPIQDKGSIGTWFS